MAYLIETLEDYIRFELGRLALDKIALEHRLAEVQKQLSGLKESKELESPAMENKT